MAEDQEKRKKQKTTLEQHSDPSIIHFKIRGRQAGEEAYYSMKQTAKLGKVLEDFCVRYHLTKDSTRFFYDSNRIRDALTPLDLQMEHGDEIEAFYPVSGGGGLFALG